MIIPINQTTLYALNQINKYKLGTVHSVYKKTINLSFDGQLLALQANHSPVSPISFITAMDSSQMDKLNISIGSPVIVSKNKLTILEDTENYSFRYGQAEIFETCLNTNLNDSELLSLKLILKDVISQVETNGLDLVFNSKLQDNSPLAIVFAGERIDTGRNLYFSEKYTEAADELSRLIGLGSGLTPSGDDFLCGMLAGITLLNMQDHPFVQQLKTNIRSHLQDTIDISAAFLSCALENQFSLAVNSLGNSSSRDKIRDRFLAIGHSSGIDTLCGVYFALSTLR